VEIPGGVDVTINGREVSVSGPKGSLALELAPPIEIAREDSTLKVTRPNDEVQGARAARALPHAGGQYGDGG